MTLDQVGLGDVAAALLALGVVWATVRAAARLVRRVVRRLDTLDAVLNRADDIQALLNRELTHNHGSSIKDDVHGLAVSINVLDGRVSSMGGRVGLLELALTTLAEAQPDLWRAMVAIANTTPPPPPHDPQPKGDLP